MMAGQNITVDERCGCGAVLRIASLSYCSDARTAAREFRSQHVCARRDAPAERPVTLNITVDGVDTDELGRRIVKAIKAYEPRTQDGAS